MKTFSRPQNSCNAQIWLHVEDHARALALVLTKGALGRCYNIGGRNKRSNLEVVETIADLLDEAALRPPPRPHHLRGRPSGA